MPESLIQVEHLSKVYRVPEREPGFKAAVKSLFQPQYRQVAAVQDVTFQIAAGERVGLLGPNGAGKTTTLKVLAGLLYPTRGQVRVAGQAPAQRSSAFLRQIGMVQGNKSQMIWDIPPLDSFQVLREIYGVPTAAFRKTLDELVALLDLGDLLTRPARNLSLGERMKCELVASLLHRPQVLFLDEPTLGLDISMQQRLRKFISDYNRQSGAAILLTSHYMADVTAICDRIILIHNGRKLYDGALGELSERLAPFKLIRLALANGTNHEAPDLPEGVKVIEKEGSNLTLRVARQDAPGITSALLASLAINDLTVEDPPVEAVIDRIYQEGSVA
ncbi:MAG TPA: ATP-binding cassette domain-containing protein [Anaerolineaceae bacterium]|nr:ATP-binding cassette domain-containing protein [Anaerolineaceae bacterium]HPN50591.1 ATP-binding cassette domain-containing protein [Anaerolineaceae bacterium]